MHKNKRKCNIAGLEEKVFKDFSLNVSTGLWSFPGNPILVSGSCNLKKIKIEWYYFLYTNVILFITKTSFKTTTDKIVYNFPWLS